MNVLKILVATLFLMSAASQASDDFYFKLEQGSLALSPIKASSEEYKIDDFYAHCPIWARCLPTKVIDLEMLFTLNGCVDQLGPVTVEHALNEETSTVDIFVSAHNIYNEKSRRVRCFRAPTATVKRTIVIGEIAGSIETVNVHYMGTKERAVPFRRDAATSTNVENVTLQQ